MAEAKPFASLSSSLLARKGGARPAMRRPVAVDLNGTHAVSDDLGWNDMGYDVDFDPGEGDGSGPKHNPLAAAAMPSTPEVKRQQHEIAERLARQAEDFHAHQDEESEPEEPKLATLNGKPFPASIEARDDAVNGEGEQALAPADEPVRLVEPSPARPVRVSVSRGAAAPRARAGQSPSGKSAFTLRLDSERHLKLRLACAVTHESAQRFVTRALDTLLATMPELDGMVAKLPPRIDSKDNQRPLDKEID